MTGVGLGLRPLSVSEKRTLTFRSSVLAMLIFAPTMPSARLRCAVFPDRELVGRREARGRDRAGGAVVVDVVSSLEARHVPEGAAPDVEAEREPRVGSDREPERVVELVGDREIEVELGERVEPVRRDRVQLVGVFVHVQGDAAALDSPLENVYLMLTCGLKMPYSPE